jgi:hypothetical protein
MKIGSDNGDILVSAYLMSKLLALVLARMVVSKLAVSNGLAHIDHQTSNIFSTYLTLLCSRYFISFIHPEYNR